MNEILQKMNDFVSEVGYEKVSELFSQMSSGKMLRSKLILKVAGKSENAVRLCAIVELIQAASLLHDDVIDKAKTRRGRASINATHGDKTAIMLGDVLYSKAFVEACALGANLASVVSKAVCSLSVGEMQDVFLSESFNADEARYFEMIHNKTAVLMEASAHAAALLAGFDESEVERFAAYGKNLGLAFQVIDDVLDVTQDAAKLGKPAFNDFAEGKTTLPYIYLFERLGERGEEQAQAKLLSFFKKPLCLEEQIWLREKFRETGALEKAVKKAREFGEKAVSLAGSSELKEIAKAMIEREF